jgi:hypothetical protein
MAPSLSPVMGEFAERRTAYGVFVFLYALFCYMVVKSQNLWLFFVPAAVGGILATVFYVIVPYNPYKNIFARKSGMNEKSLQTEPAAQRFIALLRTTEARWVALRTGLVTVTIPWLVMAIVAATRPTLPSREFGLEQISWLAIYTWLFLVLSFGVQIHCLLRWALHKFTLNKESR